MLNMVFAKKSLGQNFLKNRSILEAVRDSVGVSETDVVLEVGPGQGDLTSILLEKAGKIVAVEKDDRLIPILQEKFSHEISSGKLTLMHLDILDISLSREAKELQSRYKICANIPYYITGQFIRKFLSGENQPSDIALIIQKEVAERIIARDGKESILSLSVKAYGTPKYIRTVPRLFFSPSPNVDSAILAIHGISKKFFEEISENKFFEVIKTGFASKRKQLIGNLSHLKSREELEQIFTKVGLDLKIRAEDVNLDQWKNLIKKFM